MSNLHDDFNVQGEKEGKKKLLIVPLIICIIVAFAIWLYVVNISTENYERTFTINAVMVRGADSLAEKSNMSVIEQPQEQITVTVSGLRTDVISLSSEDFESSVNVGDITEAGSHTLDVSVKVPANVTLVSVEPTAVKVSVDEIKTVSVPVEITFSSYTMDASYSFGKVSADLDEILVKGPATVLDRILCARASLDLGVVTTSIEQKAELQLISEITGNPLEQQYIKSITMMNSGVTVSIPVTATSFVPLNVNYADGFDRSVIKNIVISPAQVKIEGDPKLLATINKLTILTVSSAIPDHVDIGLSDVSLPAGIRIIGMSGDISVDVTKNPPPEATTTSAPETSIAPLTTENAEVITENAEPDIIRVQAPVKEP